MSNSYDGVNPQPTLLVNEGNFCAGIHNVVVDGSYVGAVRTGTGATMRMVANDIPIEAAQYPGEILGIRQMGDHYELDIELIEATADNYRLMLGTAVNSVDPGVMLLGRRARLGAKRFVQIYTDGPNGALRRWSFYAAIVKPRGDFTIGHPGEFANIPLTLVLTPDRNMPTPEQYGRFDDIAQ